MEFARPTQIDEALSLLTDGPWDVLAGGTDYFPSLKDEQPMMPILDISAIESLRGIARTDDGWRIGALATWTDVIRADIPPAFRALTQAAHEVGSVQIQNRATVAGNLCNASPAADGVPPLLVMNARVELSASSGRRIVPLAEFIKGNRQTALSSDELMTAILIPGQGALGQSSFLKLGARKYLVISIAMVAVRLVVEAAHVVEAAVSVGACSATARRLTSLEKLLIGSAVTQVANVVTPEQLAILSPITDVRASDTYRQVAAIELVRRALREAAAQ